MHTPPEPDIGALQAGDPAAITALYTRYAEVVLGWVIRLGGPHLDAEDVAQEVFIVALRRMDGFRGEARLSTWLFGITRRVLANARRRALLRRFVGLSEIPEPAAAIPGAEEAVEHALRRRAIQRALDRLRQDHREVLVLSDLEERTAPEVAELLGIPSGTVYSRLHAARRAFREALRREGLAPVSAAAAPAEDNLIRLPRRKP